MEPAIELGGDKGQDGSVGTSRSHQDGTRRAATEAATMVARMVMAARTRAFVIPGPATTGRERTPAARSPATSRISQMTRGP